MKRFKSILIISGLLLLFVGNVGVNVFKHICAEDGVWTSYFVKTTDDHCENEEEAEKHAQTCCSTDEEKEEDCCNDQTEFYKIDLDYNSDPSIIVPSSNGVISPSNFEFVLNDTQQDYYTTKYVNPPPNKLGKDILIHHQVFLI